jgi:CRP-like cAMP-binding protein
MNLSRASFYRSLSSFLSRGIVSKNGSKIQIINAKELKGILS